MWHLVHYGSRAAGGFGLIMVESTGVVPEGRISPRCPGLWNDIQERVWADVVGFARATGAVVGIQLNHGGRKASSVPALPTLRSAFGNSTLPQEHGGWPVAAPSPLAFPGYDTPRELTLDDIRGIPKQFVDSAKRAVRAGFEVIEIHAAHGYLLHQFLSPLSNKRTDAYGGDFESRTRLLREVVSAVRTAVPERLPIFVRLSATDWVEETGGTEESWTVEQTIELGVILRKMGVDLLDISAGGLLPMKPPAGALARQVELAERVHDGTACLVSAVGGITDPARALEIRERGKVAATMIGRQALLEPAWPLRAAAQTGVPVAETKYPGSYSRAYWGWENEES